MRADACWSFALCCTLGCGDARAPLSRGAEDAAVHAAEPDAAEALDGAPSAARPEDAAADAAQLPYDAGLTWTSSALQLSEAGVTEPWQVVLPPDTRGVVLRTRPDPAYRAGPTCLRASDVVVDGVTTWVGPLDANEGDYCLDCEERVSVGSDHALAVLPSGPWEELVLARLSWRVSLLDCLTLTPVSVGAALPSHVVLEYAPLKLPVRTERLSLPVHVVVASDVALSASPSMLQDALAVVKEVWRAAELDVASTPPTSIAPSASPLVYDALDRSALQELEARARASLAPQDVAHSGALVILGPCLRRNDLIGSSQSEPLALTPHVPGGFAPPGSLDAIFVAGEACSGLRPLPSFYDASTLGAVIAHELGHYLGLYHVREADGREDDLVDTSPEQPNLMQRISTASQRALSDSQVRIARRHPILQRSLRR